MTTPLVICFGCASVFTSEKEANLVCPECGLSVQRDDYERLINYASNAVEFGYYYRLVYEEDLEQEGELNSRYMLEPVGPFLTFIAISALSGIIGNVSHKLLKKVIQKIRKKSIDVKDKENEAISFILNNPNEYSKFINYLEGFHKELSNINPEVKKAILGEMIVHASLDVIKAENKMNEAQIKAKLLLKMKKKLEEKDFEKFWTNLD